jgi:hypothetical protein
MGLRQIQFLFTTNTLAVGPYDLYANSISPANLIAGDLSLNTLKAGVIYSVDDAVNTFIIYNQTCNSSQLHTVQAVSPSPTPSITPTVTPTKTITPTPTITITPTSTVTPTVTPSITTSPIAINIDFGTGFANSTFGSGVYGLIKSNGKYFVNGGFGTYRSQTPSYATSINQDGTINPAWSGKTSSTSRNNILGSQIDSDGDFYFTGGTGNWNGFSYSQIVKVNQSGVAYTSWTPTLHATFTDPSNTLQILNNKLYVGGSGRIGSVNIDGSTNSLFKTNVLANGTGRIMQANGKLFWGGNLTSYFWDDPVGTVNYFATKGLIYINEDGTPNTAFNFTRDVDDAAVNAIVYDPTINKYYIGGYFNAFNNSGVNTVIRLNADFSYDSTFTAGAVAGGNAATALTLTPEGKLLAGFQNGTIYLYNSDGSVNTSYYTFGTGGNTQINGLYVETDNSLIIYGNFTSFNGTTANNIIRLPSTIIISPSVTPTITATPTKTPSITATPSITPSITVSPSITPTKTTTPSITPTITKTPSITLTPSITPTPTITKTPTPTITPTKSIPISPYRTITISNPQSNIYDACSQILGLTEYIDNTLSITTGLIMYANSALTIKTYTYNPGGYTWLKDSKDNKTYVVTFDANGVIFTVQDCTTLPSQTPTPTPTITPTKTPTITPTPSLPYSTFSIYANAATGTDPKQGWGTYQNACAGTGIPVTVYVNATGITSVAQAVSAGRSLYISNNFISGNLYNGGNTWFKTQSQVGGDYYQLGTAGDIFNYNTCPAPSPTPTVTPTITVTPSITPSITVTPSITKTPSPTPTPTPVYYEFPITTGYGDSTGACADSLGTSRSIYGSSPSFLSNSVFYDDNDLIAIYVGSNLYYKNTANNEYVQINNSGNQTAGGTC